MEIKQVEKTKTVTVYVASDGKEYDSWDACNRHEEYMKKHEAFDWLREHDVSISLSDSLHAYIVRDFPDNDAHELYAIVVTADVLERLKKADCDWLPEEPTDKLGFVSIYSDEDAYYEGDVDSIIASLAESIANLAKHIR